LAAIQTTAEAKKIYATGVQITPSPEAFPLEVSQLRWTTSRVKQNKEHVIGRAPPPVSTLLGPLIQNFKEVRRIFILPITLQLWKAV
jgi:hypothetical protein